MRPPYLIWGKYPKGISINLGGERFHDVTHVYGIVGNGWFFGVQVTKLRADWADKFIGDLEGRRDGQ